MAIWLVGFYALPW